MLELLYNLREMIQTLCSTHVAEWYCIAWPLFCLGIPLGYLLVAALAVRSPKR